MLGRTRALSASLLAACSAAEPTPATAEPTDTERPELRRVIEAALAPCPEPAEPRGPGDRDQVFVEAVVLEAPSELAAAADLESLPELARAPGVRLLGTPRVTTDLGSSATQTIEERSGLVSRPALHRISVAARRAEPDVSVLDLTLELQLPNRDPARTPPTAQVTTTLAPRDRHAVVRVLPLPDDRSRSLVAVVVPRPIREERDLRAIFECKLAHASRGT